MLKTKVKVGSITNLSEARYCAGMGVDFLSFPVPTIDPKTYQEITSWVAGPKFGIEIAEHAENLEQYAADFIHASLNALDLLHGKTNLIIKLAPDQWKPNKEKLIEAKNKILFLEFVISAFDESTERILREASEQFELLINLSGQADLDQALQLPIAGVSLEGSAEVSVGLKEYPLAEVLEKLEVE